MSEIQKQADACTMTISPKNVSIEMSVASKISPSVNLAQDSDHILAHSIWLEIVP